MKKTNQNLLDELNQIKTRNNEIEFELEKNKLAIDIPLRENKQLKKDIEDLLEKLTEKQTMYLRLFPNLNKVFFNQTSITFKDPTMK